MMLSISATALVLMTMMIVVVLTDRALLDRVLSFEQFDLAAARSRSAGSAASFRMGATRQVEESPVEEPAREYAAPALVRRHEDGPRAASTPWEAQQAYLRCLTIWVSHDSRSNERDRSAREQFAAFDTAEEECFSETSAALGPVPQRYSKVQLDETFATLKRLVAENPEQFGDLRQIFSAEDQQGLKPDGQDQGEEGQGRQDRGPDANPMAFVGRRSGLDVGALLKLGGSYLFGDAADRGGAGQTATDRTFFRPGFRPRSYIRPMIP